jgi:hypothetical protein
MNVTLARLRRHQPLNPMKYSYNHETACPLPLPFTTITTGIHRRPTTRRDAQDASTQLHLFSEEFASFVLRSYGRVRADFLLLFYAGGAGKPYIIFAGTARMDAYCMRGVQVGIIAEQESREGNQELRTINGSGPWTWRHVLLAALGTQVRSRNGKMPCHDVKKRIHNL